MHDVRWIFREKSPGRLGEDGVRKTCFRRGGSKSPSEGVEPGAVMSQGQRAGAAPSGPLPRLGPRGLHVPRWHLRGG